MELGHFGQHLERAEAIMKPHRLRTRKPPPPASQCRQVDSSFRSRAAIPTWRARWSRWVPGPDAARAAAVGGGRRRGRRGATVLRWTTVIGVEEKPLRIADDGEFVIWRARCTSCGRRRCTSPVTANPTPWRSRIARELREWRTCLDRNGPRSTASSGGSTSCCTICSSARSTTKDQAAFQTHDLS